MIDHINGHESITGICLVRDKLIINIDESVAEDFHLSVTEAINDSSVKVQAKKFYGLLKGVQSDFELSNLIPCPGKSTWVELEFSDAKPRA